MRHRDRQRHAFGRFVAGEPEHQALVAGALLLVEALAFSDAHRDVGGLRLDRGQHGASMAVETDVRIVVADFAGDLAGDRHIVGPRAAGDLAGQHDQSRFDERFQRDARVGVLGDQRVEHGIRDLVAHLVGMPLRHRLRREKEILKRHSNWLLASPSDGAASESVRIQVAARVCSMRLLCQDRAAEAAIRKSEHFASYNQPVSHGSSSAAVAIVAVDDPGLSVSRAQGAREWSVSVGRSELQLP